MPTSTRSTSSKIHSPSVTTCSPPSLKKRVERDLVTRWIRAPLSRLQSFSMTPTSPKLSTGELLVESTLLRTRDNADHAGHSQPPVLLSLLTGEPLRPSSASPSNRLFPALSRTTDAKVDGKPKPSPTSRTTDRSSKVLTLTFQVPPKSTSNAITNLQRPRLRLPTSQLFHQTPYPNSRLLSITVSSQ